MIFIYLTELFFKKLADFIVRFFRFHSTVRRTNKDEMKVGFWSIYKAHQRLLAL